MHVCRMTCDVKFCRNMESEKHIVNAEMISSIPTAGTECSFETPFTETIVRAFPELFHFHYNRNTTI